MTHPGPATSVTGGLTGNRATGHRSKHSPREPGPHRHPSRLSRPSVRTAPGATYLLAGDLLLAAAVAGQRELGADLEVSLEGTGQRQASEAPAAPRRR